MPKIFSPDDPASMGVVIEDGLTIPSAYSLLSICGSGYELPVSPPMSCRPAATFHDIIVIKSYSSEPLIHIQTLLEVALVMVFYHKHRKVTDALCKNNKCF